MRAKRLTSCKGTLHRGFSNLCETSWITVRALKLVCGSYAMLSHDTIIDDILVCLPSESATRYNFVPFWAQGRNDLSLTIKQCSRIRDGNREIVQVRVHLCCRSWRSEGVKPCVRFDSYHRSIGRPVGSFNHLICTAA